MISKIFLGLLVVVLFSCGADKSEAITDDKSNNVVENPESPKKEDKHSRRIEAVEVNNQLSLNHAHAFILIDSLLKQPSVLDMKTMLPEVQIEIVAIKHRVEDLNSELEGALKFKEAVLNQLEYIETGLKSEIPTMIKVSESGKQKIADEMYFEWIKLFEEKNQIILAAQMQFVEKYNIKMN